MLERPQRYSNLPPEEEAELRGVPVEIIKVEREVNARLIHPEFLAAVNEILGWRGSESETPSKAADPHPRRR